MVQIMRQWAHAPWVAATAREKWHTSGQSRAARTRTGINDTWPSTVSTAESPSTNSSLLRPSFWLYPAAPAPPGALLR